MTLVEQSGASRQMISTEDSMWFVISTQPQREKVAVEHLERQDFTTYLPLIAKTIRHARRVQEVRRPLFPGYVFVQRDSGQPHWRPILGTFGVRSLVRCGDHPSLLNGGLLAALMKREIDGVVRRPANPFSIGQGVIVKNSSLEGLAGKIVEMREKDRIVVLLGLLGQQVKVNVSAGDLQAAAP